MTHNNQWAALVTAAHVVEELPEGTVFSVTVTDDDGDSVLNIYLKAGQAITPIKTVLRLQELVDFSDTFETYRVGPLLVSIILEEEENGRDSE